MITGWKSEINCGPYFFYKKHYCVDCNSLLIRKKHEKIVNSKSEEARKFDFSSPGGDGYMFGNVKFITYHFECSDCARKYEISELKALEKKAKKSRQFK